MNKLTGKTAFITGASRGIGHAIALRLAKAGANIVIAAKTTEPNPKLPGTIYTVAQEIEALALINNSSGRALALPLDVRDDAAIQTAVAQAAEHFGGIDILVNNASAISLTPTLATPLKRFDLMLGVNARATFACSQACIPYLKNSLNPHILNLSPPLNIEAKWFQNHTAYTLSKYGMSMCTLGMSAEFQSDGIAVNSLWPKTTIATAAIAAHFPPEMIQASRTPEIVAEAAYYILTSNSREVTGQFFTDEEILAAHGITDFSQYAVNPTVPLQPDLFL
jgi:citronellol/citronellal dehydrogenase